LVAEFIRSYNTERLHSSIGYITPLDKLNGKEEEIFKARDMKLEAARAASKREREHSAALSSKAINC
jgi:hypothetical protein